MEQSVESKLTIYFEEPFWVGVFEELCGTKLSVCRIVFGAFFSMNADIDSMIEKAYFISPIVDMERLVTDMMSWANVTEYELKEKGIIRTSFGEDLSWEYLCYVRAHPIKWNVPTAILYGSRDNLTSPDTITTFAKRHNAKLTVMENVGHWFHTDEQMRFLDDWIKTACTRE